MTRGSGDKLILALAGLLIACGGTRGDPAEMPAKAPPAASATPIPTMATLQRAAILTTGRPLSASAERRYRAALGAATWDAGAFIDELVHDPGFAEQAARIILKRAYNLESTITSYQYVLKRAALQTPSGAPFFYLYKECAPSEAIQVAPWWNLRSHIWICPDAYRPDTNDLPIGGAGQRGDSAVKTQSAHCSSYLAYKQGGCGCGENLRRCYADYAHLKQVNASAKDEVRAMVHHNLTRDRPLAALFTGNASHRDATVEFLYRRWRLENGDQVDLQDLAAWPAAGKRAPRPEVQPGQHAGVLTTPKLVHYDTDERQRMRTFSQIVWCSEPNSVGAQPEDVLSLPANSLQIRNEGWQELAARPLCTNCHARLDYSMQFWTGFPDLLVTGQLYSPALRQPGKGPLYHDHIGDDRGQEELSPAGWARLATAQPEFGYCMAKNVGDYVLGTAKTALDDQILRETFAKRPHLSALFKAALRRYLERQPGTSSAAIATATGPGQAGPALSGEIEKTLENHCADCHMDGELDFTKPVLTRTTLLRILEQVGYGRMPRWPATMAEKERAVLVERLIVSLWSDTARRDAARALYQAKNRPPSAQLVGNALETVHRLAGDNASPAAWGTAEWGVDPAQAIFTPGFATMIGIEALKACKARSKSEDALAQCLQRATDFRAHTR